MPFKHSDAVIRLLRAAGWHEGRRIDVSPWESLPTKLFPAARRVLAEFGGLVIGETGRGIDFARSDVDLRLMRPSPGSSGYEDLEREMGQRLFWLGMVHDANAELVIDESGRVYDYLDELRYLAPTFAAALEILLLGKRQASI
jgi:hypothetical protein